MVTVYVVGQTVTEPEDWSSPTPNPAQWATQPYGASPTSIRMVAVEAVDDSGVQYRFECDSHPSLTSAWQDSREYVAEGLARGVYGRTPRGPWSPVVALARSSPLTVEVAPGGMTKSDRCNVPRL